MQCARDGALPCAALWVAVIAGCALTPARLDAPKSVAGLELTPFSIAEECLSLQAGERIDFRFDASVPVAFNVHFREGNAVILPFSRERTAREEGDFTADRAEVYCLSWEAGPAGTTVNYRVSPWPPRR